MAPIGGELAAPLAIMAFVLFGGAAILTGTLLVTGGLIRRNPRHLFVGVFLLLICLFAGIALWRG